MSLPSFRPHQVEWTPEKVDRVWSFNTAREGSERYFSSHAGEGIVRYVRRHLSLRSLRVLDFGCGPGHLMRKLLDAGVPCAGLEFSERSVREARDALGPHPLFRGVVHATTVPTPGAEASYDVIFFIEVIEHLLEQQLSATLQELARLLAPGGHLVVTTPNAEELDAGAILCPDCGATFHRWQHMRSLTRARLAELLREHGFDVVHAQATYFARLSPIQRAARTIRSLIGRPFSPHLIVIARRPAASIA